MIQRTPATPSRPRGRPPAAVVELEHDHENTLGRLWEAEQDVCGWYACDAPAAVALSDVHAAVVLLREAEKLAHPHIRRGAIVRRQRAA